MLYSQSPSGACTIKHFTVVIYVFLQYASVFILGKPFQPCLIFVGNIIQDWKGLPWKNTLAYENLQITAVKSFIIQALGVVFTALHFRCNL